MTKKAPAPEHRVDVAFNTVSFASFFLSCLSNPLYQTNTDNDQPTQKQASKSDGNL